MLVVREGVPVLENNSVYKGYRLRAKVVREVSPVASGPLFTATIVVVQADSIHDEGDEYPVPYFAEGASVYSPREAVHAAVAHGREIVDGLMTSPRAG
ncbi:hypothetical protein [Bordetella avium]|uniref:Uncharacterized protein n=1 Tax=Bordetella avium (strain 197N) TaxID=360910 RepID=Q2KWV5_BORA1|nr:hypothetical protein C0J09_13035 [Bordetella avium]CAJ50212.1 hypothetical protein BAV2600 [Bordetella avium 197N]AZY53315.1 hypothetical protein C0J07_13145 [Bordetella avium]RIQ13185.1 hypothetical protein D0432_10925 [Bordetella avium]RIQ17304.1 hypothetical protein D0850_10515 [Bordetella avium]